ncbi:4-amino-4-deoxy-L-arabinose transferase-like glycosyltransferase [Motilibacter peucedani]|uniref:4-amino-4-deoxy-L-arabinose transferase-like glycosyltransferase n=2 Tax=Motilibacter peucedani TaxID=598650 RepID=A0A420XN97_9ACTN|nr:4-amino-4-deoxy-L-arabinose transferase-like glycosyltransferase [Motilibacter peucedani]
MPTPPGKDLSWVRPALVGLLALTAVLYLWGLGASGWANSFYAAAVQAGSVSWKAFFFGSSDAASSITVDKTPASLWVMALSARVFGMSSWSMLVPQALMGVASVGLLYEAVRRVTTPAAGLFAGAVLALTPVAVLMFRFNNPDALLVLLLMGAAYAMTRAVEKAETRWLLLAGTLIGFGFLTKMLQALLVVPGFALAYLVLAPTPVRRRIVQLLGAGLALLVSCGWWIATVELMPASARPYIGGSQHNSILELVIGYNGLGRLSGNETGSVGGGGGGGTGMWGETGILRLFDAEMGGQASWLVPAALLLLVGGLVALRRAARTDVARAALLLWGSWLVVTFLTFSFMRGIFHAYYNVALAPAIGATVGIGAALVWRERAALWARCVLAAAVLVSAWWAWVLLGRSADFVPWLRPVVLVVGVVAAVALLAPQLGARVTAAAVTLSLVAALAGPAAYAVETAATPHTGSIVTAGPTVAGSGGPGGRGGFGGQRGPGGPGGQPPAGVGGGTGAPTGGPTGGGAGGLLNGSTPTAELTALLQTNADDYTWVAAAVGSNTASGYQLASGDPVMAIGGFNGSDPSPTLAELEALVAAGTIHYFIGGGGMGMGSQRGGSNASGEIASWVSSTYTATTVGGVTVYDLSAR